MIAAALLVVAGIAKFAAGFGAAKNFRPGRQPAPVGVATVARADMPVTVSAIGTVTPVDTAVVRSQLAGNLVAIRFREGQEVRRGQVIAEIDRRPYRLTLAQAEANAARDGAQLAAAETDLKRYQGLLAQDSIARQQVDSQAATVRQLTGTLAADKAAIGTARLNLDYSAVRAPISGRIGLRQVALGNYVTPGDANGIAAITRTDPIDVQFAIAQRDLARIRKAAGSATGLPVVALDQDGATVLAKGHFATFDNQISTASGTVQAKARFDNPGSAASQVLFPNQFVNVRLQVDMLRGVNVVPVAAVRHGAPGDFVFVVGADQTVRLVVVKTGPSDGTNIAILDGLHAGQRVVTEGADTLDDGSKVRLPRNGGGGEGGANAGAYAGAYAGANAGVSDGAGGWKHGGHHRRDAGQ